jgi:hypothetical protein
MPSGDRSGYRSAIKFIAGVAVFLAVVVWLYARYVYNPVIFGLRDDFVHAVPNTEIPDGLTPSGRAPFTPTRGRTRTSRPTGSTTTTSGSASTATPPWRTSSRSASST